MIERRQHRKVVVTRRTKFQLRKCLDRAHILEGLIIAVKNIDRVVKIIRAAKARGIRVTAEACPHHFTLTDRKSVV